MKQYKVEADPLLACFKNRIPAGVKSLDAGRGSTRARFTTLRLVFETVGSLITSYSRHLI